MVETLSKNITRQGLTATTLNYLRVSSNVAEAVMEEGQGPSGSGVSQDQDSLPLPSAHTLTGQIPTTNSIDNLDFGSDSFQFQ